MNKLNRETTTCIQNKILKPLDINYPELRGRSLLDASPVLDDSRSMKTFQAFNNQSTSLQSDFSPFNNQKYHEEPAWQDPFAFEDEDSFGDAFDFAPKTLDDFEEEGDSHFQNSEHVQKNVEDTPHQSTRATIESKVAKPLIKPSKKKAFQ